MEEVKKHVHPRRFVIRTTGENEKAIEKMQHEFAKLADAEEQIWVLNQKKNNMAETFNPIRREMLNSVRIVDELSKHQMITPNEARAMTVHKETQAILYADDKIYEFDSGVDMWKCSYCGGIRVGERCKGCGAPRLKAEV